MREDALRSRNVEGNVGKWEPRYERRWWLPGYVEEGFPGTEEGHSCFRGIQALQVARSRAKPIQCRALRICLFAWWMSLLASSNNRNNTSEATRWSLTRNHWNYSIWIQKANQNVCSIIKLSDTALSFPPVLGHSVLIQDDNLFLKGRKLRLDLCRNFPRSWGCRRLIFIQQILISTSTYRWISWLPYLLDSGPGRAPALTNAMWANGHVKFRVPILSSGPVSCSSTSNQDENKAWLCSFTCEKCVLSLVFHQEFVATCRLTPLTDAYC